jgi:hypothetical protein
MSATPTILILGRQPAIMAHVLPLVAAAGFKHKAAITDEEAKNNFQWKWMRLLSEAEWRQHQYSN